MESPSEVGFLSDEVEKMVERKVQATSTVNALGMRVNKLGQKIIPLLTSKEGDLQRLLVSLWFCRILSIYQATLLLLKRGMSFESRVLLRSALEVAFSLIATSKNKDYCYAFIEDETFKMKNKIKKYSKIPDEFKVKDAVYKVSIDQIEALITNNKYKELSTWDIAEKAGMLDYYNSMYAVLSDAVHCRIRDLESHLVLNDAGDLIGLKWGPETDDLEELRQGAIEMVLISMKQVLMLFDLTQYSDEYHACCAEFDGLP